MRKSNKGVLQTRLVTRHANDNFGLGLGLGLVLSVQFGPPAFCIRSYRFLCHGVPGLQFHITIY